MKQAIVDKNRVVNIILADQAFADSIRLDHQYVVDISNVQIEPMMGWGYDGVSFIPEKKSDQLTDQYGDLATAIEAQLALFDAQTRDYVYQTYPAEKQATLLLLRGDARADGLQNRFAYIQRAVDWISILLGYHFPKYHEIESAKDMDSLSQITWDFTQFDATNPLVSIEQALGIQD